MRSDLLPPDQGQVAFLHAAGLDEAGGLMVEPTGRRVAMVEREQMAENAARGLPGPRMEGLAEGAVETEGVCLRAWVGRLVVVGQALVRIDGLREASVTAGLADSTTRLGVWAVVVRAGRVQVGDRVAALPDRMGSASVAG